MTPNEIKTQLEHLSQIFIPPAPLCLNHLPPLPLLFVCLLFAVIHTYLSCIPFLPTHHPPFIPPIIHPSISPSSTHPYPHHPPIHILHHPSIHTHSSSLPTAQIAVLSTPWFLYFNFRPSYGLYASTYVFLDLFLRCLCLFFRSQCEFSPSIWIIHMSFNNMFLLWFILPYLVYSRLLSDDSGLLCQLMDLDISLWYFKFKSVPYTVVRLINSTWVCWIQQVTL